MSDGKTILHSKEFLNELSMDMDSEEKAIESSPDSDDIYASEIGGDSNSDGSDRDES